MTNEKKLFSVFGLLLVLLLCSTGAFAAEIDTGDTAWILVSTAMVLLMTPGLAFFYGGMVKRKNVVSTLFQSFVTMSIVGLLWVLVGYSLAFGSGNALIGDFSMTFLKDVGMEASGTIPHLLFMAFQAMFAIITTALITGAIAERFSFKAWMWVGGLWSILVYAPVAHWVWGGGWISTLGGLDFAGGMVVHMTAGWSALTAALIIKKRSDFTKSFTPYNTGWVLLGTALLWFGWFGFNAGSALGANGLAANAFVTTFIASATALLGWALVDKLKTGKPTAMGAGVGAVAGLVAITPAAGFVTPMASILIGALAGVICNYVAGFMKAKLKVDDSLDVFACHGIGGLLGVLLTGIFAKASVGGVDGLMYGGVQAFQANVLGALGVIAISVIGTFIIVKIVGLFTPVTVEKADEVKGLDKSQHNEQIDG